LGNVFGNTFKGSVYSNTIGDNFAFNNVGYNFQDNTIDEYFGYGASVPQGNIIGNYFYDNIIGEYFYNNSIPDNFKSNTIGDYFQWNVINTEVLSTNFTINYGNITGFSYTASGDTASDDVYNNLSGVTNNNGVDATFNVEVSGGEVIGVSGSSQGRLYFTGNTIRISGNQIGGVTGVIDGFNSDAIGKSGATGTYDNVFAQGTGEGENGSFNIVVVDDLVDSISLSGGGSSYLIGDVLTIDGSVFGGVDGTDDITITVTSLYSDDIVITVTGVSQTPPVYEQYTKQIFKRADGQRRLSYYDENDILTIQPITDISFTLSSTDFTDLNNGGGVTPSGTLGFTTDGLYDAGTSFYRAYDFVGNKGTEINTFFNNNGLLTNSTGYIFDVTWGAGSSIYSGKVLMGFSGTALRIAPINTGNNDWQTPGQSNFDIESIAGTFNFTAAFTLYSPITAQNNSWC